MVNKSQDKSEKHLWAPRQRSRRFGRISTQRLLVWLLSLALIFLICFAYFGVKMHFHGPVSLHLKSNASYVAQQPRKPHRQRFSPCEVLFLDSVNYILEPEDNTKFTRFSLGYVEREDRAHLNETIEARFGGHQSLKDRENAYLATNQTIHCGFVSGSDDVFSSTGFDLDENDKKYMNTCKVVVSSCIFGSSDFLRRPTSKVISEFSKKNVCFVMFVDKQSLAKLSAEGNVPDERGNIGLWKIVVVKNLPYEDMRKTGKSDGLTKHDSSDPKTSLPSFVPEGSFIVRAHTAMSNLFSCLWFNEVDRFTSRDQLSFGYTYLKLKRMNPDKHFYLNMFKDCERRAITKLFHHRTDT
ncbi:hypothetical protein PHJA_000880000 [Phtheirospermum japonicum]|uniref:TOD1/MUCI70 glycosyltransferase-like domain-containing protein n=1 Tax=Phtheirospermum japonicum TaxID=374723 RepID=A0A830BTQ2_9LAMI|nr:hypothetical protein PHJA_000880000 [Phtheirospermum japonicum]